METSELKAIMKTNTPELLKYYEHRREGRLDGKTFEDCGGSKREVPPVVELTRMTFFRVDYSQGFTGRGGKLPPYAHNP